jgi:hypothetical protein
MTLKSTIEMWRHIAKRYGSHKCAAPNHKHGNIEGMRTTIDIPDATYRQLKSKAALEGTSVKSLILRGVNFELGGAAIKSARHVTLPLIRSKKPGSLRLTNAKINEILFP